MALPHKCSLAQCGAVGVYPHCQRCKSAWYCCRAHQSQDWPKHRRACLKATSPPVPAAPAVVCEPIAAPKSSADVPLPFPPKAAISRAGDAAAPEVPPERRCDDGDGPFSLAEFEAFYTSRELARARWALGAPDPEELRFDGDDGPFRCVGARSPPVLEYVSLDATLLCTVVRLLSCGPPPATASPSLWNTTAKPTLHARDGT